MSMMAMLCFLTYCFDLEIGVWVCHDECKVPQNFHASLYTFKLQKHGLKDEKIGWTEYKRETKQCWLTWGYDVKYACFKFTLGENMISVNIMKTQNWNSTENFTRIIRIKEPFWYIKTIFKPKTIFYEIHFSGCLLICKISQL